MRLVACVLALALAGCGPEYDIDGTWSGGGGLDIAREGGGVSMPLRLEIVSVNLITTIDRHNVFDFVRVPSERYEQCKARM